MGMKINKTNAARLLDRAHIAYELVPYEVDEEHLAAAHVAEQLNEDIAQVFKTLVLRGDRTGILVCVIPGDGEVNLKLAAKVSGNKSVEMLHMKELLPTTGYMSRWLFADRDEKEFSHVYPFELQGFRPYLCECRRTRTAIADGSGRPGALCGCRGDRLALENL